jgi:hypothetical protein
VAPERLDEGEVDAVIVLAASYSEEVANLIAKRFGSRFKVAVLRDSGLCAVARDLTP